MILYCKGKQKTCFLSTFAQNSYVAADGNRTSLII